jgi:hypothetical protein
LTLRSELAEEMVTLQGYRKRPRYPSLEQAEVLLQ